MKKNYILYILIVAVVGFLLVYFISSKKAPTKPDDEPTEKSNATYQVDFDISSHANLIFSTYDITITVDENEIGTVSNGNRFTYTAVLSGGKHKLTFCKSGASSPKATRTVNVTGNISYSCNLTHESSSIGIENETIKDIIPVESTSIEKFEMINVTGFVLSKAKAELTKIGFTNIDTETKSVISKDSDWIVLNQSVVPGQMHGKDDEILLTCSKIEDSLDSLFVGKDINEIQKTASQIEFTVNYLDYSWLSIDDKVRAMDEQVKSLWYAAKIKKYDMDEKSIVLFMKNKNVDTSDTQQEKSEGSLVLGSRNITIGQYKYSTNSKDTVKDGDSGVYAYIRECNEYDIYYIIDFDEGYVYYFLDGNGDTTCDKVKITFGNLNDGLIFTYHDGDYSWSEGLHFKWRRQPDQLIWVDSDGFESEYKTTNLVDAIKIIKNKEIHEY